MRYNKYRYLGAVRTCIALYFLLVGIVFVTQPAYAGPLQDKVLSLTHSHNFRTFLNDTTWVYHDASVGTLAIYLGNGGRPASIWHSNSNTIVAGRWGGGTISSTRPDLAVFCLYMGSGVQVLPPADNVGIVPDNESRCYHLLNFSQGVSTVLAGNPYALRRARSAPARIPDRRRYSVQQLMRLTGGDVATLYSANLSR